MECLGAFVSGEMSGCIGRIVRRSHWFLAVFAIFLTACGTNVDRNPAGSVEELRAATEHYAGLVRAMDHSGIAKLFTDRGELVAGTSPAIRGPSAIEAHLRSFSEYRVLEETLTAERVSVMGDSGQVVGTYHQRVRIPSGRVVEVAGTFAADWVRDSSRVWRISRMATMSRQ